MRRNNSGKFSRTLSTLAATVLLAVGLSGCIKFDMDMKIDKNEKVSGTFIVAISEGVITMMGQKPDDFIKDMMKEDPNTTVPKGAKVKQTAYHKGGWAGVSLEYTNMPISEFTKSAGKAAGGVSGGSTSTSGDDFSLKKVGGNYEFSGTMDFSTGTGTSGSDASTKQMLKQFKPEMRVKMTFPGDIIKTNGKKDGKSVTWVPVMGKKVVMQATAKAS